MVEESMEDARGEELASLSAIFPELKLDADRPHSASLEIPVRPRSPLKIVFNPAVGSDGILDLVANLPATADHDGNEGNVPQSMDMHEVTHLPALTLRIDLPDGYPDISAPRVALSTNIPWLPDDVMSRLSSEAEKLWQEYGRSQVIFAYIDYIQQEAENGFDIAKDQVPLNLPHKLKFRLLNYELETKREIFRRTTFDCGICLEPKSGAVCHQMARCGHVFCIRCLQDFYTAAITEGSISTVKCLGPDCGTERMTVEQRRAAKQRTLHPKELLAIPLDSALVKRYVDLKVKKKLESPKNVVFCPRKWCGAAAGTAKHRKYLGLAHVTEYPESDEENEEDEHKEEVGDRLAVCSKCTYAFCRRCLGSWHGELVACRPDWNSISAEDRASYKFMELYTSPCPSCDAPVQKSMGCNHMRCGVCETHFCYLCSAWLEPQSPYIHFNTPGTPCFQRLWMLEEGDGGVEAQSRDLRRARAAIISLTQRQREAVPAANNAQR